MTKTIYLFVLVVFLIAICSARKRAEFEELESILEDIDDAKRSRDMASKHRHHQHHQRQQQDEYNTDEQQQQQQQRVDPSICDNHVCGWGKECVVQKDRPVCQCTSKCPIMDSDPMDQVCANNNQTYNSLCELYRQRCVCKKRSGFESECEHPSNSKIHLEYLGACKNLDECTDELMAQFPERMADWLFQVMKELKKRRELHNLEWEELISEAESNDEKKHIYPVIWKFCDLDIKPHDKHVSHHELIPITAPVIPMESCIKPFLEKCDSDRDGSITIKEWGICLGLKEGEIQERC